MLKRICAVIFMLFSVLSLGYACYNAEMKAASVTFNAGGNVTGRINKAPAGLSNNEYGLRKGDKIVVGLDNPMNNSDLGFMLIHYNENYTDYKLNPGDMTNPILSDSPISGWYVMSTSSIANIAPFNSNSQFDTVTLDGYPYAKYSNSNLITEMNNLNASVVGTKIENLILPRDYEDYKIIWNVKCGITNTGPCTSNGEAAVKNALEDNGYFFLYLNTDLYINIGGATNSSYTLNILKKDITFNESYWSIMNDHTPLASRSYSWRYFSSDGKAEVKEYASTTKMAVRPAAFLDLSKVVFGISAGSGNGFANVSSHNIPSSYTSLWNETVDRPHMKLRVEDATLTATTDLMDIENKDGISITKAALNSHAYLKATAQAGSGIAGTNTVSVLLFDKDGKFVYYKPLEDAKGSGLYDFDLSGLPKGKYKIGIVNEVYNENSTAPADCSAISNVQALEIVEPHKILIQKLHRVVRVPGKIMNSVRM